MDNSVDAQVAQWATPLPGAIALTAVGVCCGVAAAASYQDPVEMLLLTVAAVGVLVYGILALIRRPRLQLDTGPTLTVRGARGIRVLAPSDVTSIESLDTRRLVFHAKQMLLEERDGRLTVFTRWDLGADPGDVVETLRAAGYPARPN
ncbi:MAG: PH domain-containing protein [Gordonia sp. (in: high G+C Gram-positive bacteria)]|uniref:PH domain-containing protein n=1 Tax=Gordonia sp. (in: high G+C Gram-positive bacteria) TaxID=84139 RepID=UPI0039E5FE68